jgi:hypothetical protein
MCESIIKKGGVLGVGMLCLALVSPVWADSVAVAEADDEWAMELDLYAWAKSIKGSSNGTDIDLDFWSDIWDVLDGFAFVNFEAEKGGLLLFGGYEYSKLALDKSEVSFNHPTLPVQIGGDSLSVNDTQHMYELGAGWRVVQSDDLEVFIEGGARYFDYTLRIKVDEVTATVPSPIPGRPPVEQQIGPAEYNSGDTWYQPFVGARFTKHLDKDWRLHGRADYGNNPFTGDDSNHSWTAEVLVDWSFNDWGALQLGYRYSKMNFDNGRDEHAYSWDMKDFGPIAGVIIKF